MLEIKGFRGIRFNPQTVGPLENVVTPPFDVIGPQEREMLASRSPYNMVHLILPKERADMDRYAAAAQDLNEWLAEGVFRVDEDESFYLLEQRFRDLEGRERVRRAFFAVTRLPEEGEELVLGHERTFRHKIEDRLALTAATQANLGAVFVLYADPERRLEGFLKQMEARPEDDAAETFEGTRNRLWRVPVDSAVVDFFRDKKLYIADGHHRYRTAWEHRAELRAKEQPDGLREYDYVLMGFVELDDPGLTIYAPHRVVDTPADFDAAGFLKNLEPWFEVEKVEDGTLLERVNQEPGCAMGAVIRGTGNYLLRLRDIDRGDFLGRDRGEAFLDLDMAVLHRGVIERVLGYPDGTEFVYEPDAAKAVALVDSGEKGIAFLLKPTRPEQVCACAEAHEPMPQKATYFYPKLPSGGVIHRLV
ncbi:MAG: DUF1015 domain-containing protein [FCB group bacterium]|jgi:uncharacterized protein (DUF1015 family)|nr:DUF1015 domain-containing protein [FCB group bacterium]